MQLSANAPKFTNGELFPSNMHRLDIVIMNRRTVTVPLFSDMRGEDILQLVRRWSDVRDFVICRNPQQGATFYELLYLSIPQPEIQRYNLIKISGKFESTLISELFAPSREIRTEKKRMSFFVFEPADYFQMLPIALSTQSAFLPKHRSPSPIIKVKLPTGLVLPLKITMQTVIRDISKELYTKLQTLYTNVKPPSGYRFGTVYGNWPSMETVFGKDPALVSAMKRQATSNTYQFWFAEVTTQCEFDKMAAKWQKELDLSLTVGNEETRALNASLSKVRIEVDKRRKEMLDKEPLLARMRINDSDPPLTTYTSKINPADAGTSTIAMKVELGPKMKCATSLSTRIAYNATANEAINSLLLKMKRLSSRSHGQINEENSDSASLSGPGSYIPTIPSLPELRPSFPNISLVDGKCPTQDRLEVLRVAADREAERGDWNPNDFVLVLRGMDEILAGDTPLCHFLCVRQFLLSGQKILNLILEKRQDVIENIRSREMGESFIMPEPGPESIRSDFGVHPPSDVPFVEMGGYRHCESSDKLTILVRGCLGIPPSEKVRQFCVVVCLIHGLKQLCRPVQTRFVYGSTSVLFNDKLTLDLPISSIPRMARISFTVYSMESSKKEKTPISTYNFPVFQHNGWMNTGALMKKMWLNKDMDFFLSTCESNEEHPVFLLFSLPKFRFPMLFAPKPLESLSGRPRSGSVSMQQTEITRIARLRRSDPLEVLTDDDKNILWKYRHILTQYRELLPLVLLTIDYSKPEQVSEVPGLLRSWTKPSASEALTLLDAKYADGEVRRYAVERLDEFPDNELMLYLLQIVQALKYEVYDDSPLARFLVKRGLLEPKFFGHQVFWQLISEAHLSHVRQRFSGILINFMYGTGSYSEELHQGYKFTQQLVDLNNELSKYNHEEATEKLRDALRRVEIPKEFHLPMDPRLIVESFVIEKCQVMNSKKKPLWLAFKNASIFADEPVFTMFKVGDDLRQDQLTLQVMKVMEHLWRRSGTDFHMRCYGVLPTGLNQGFVEVVPNSVTESKLQVDHGKVTGVWANDIILNYLQRYNATGRGLSIAREIFRLSSAGYAIATSVLGVADRHPGNIMIQQDGHFFHIDFGHFLGNWKSKLGVKREAGLFHFAPACAEAIGKDKMSQFKDDCWKALCVLRNNSKLLITLFLLMLGTGIPELTKPEDVIYLKSKLYTDLEDEEARKKLLQLIKESKRSTRTYLNNLCHNVRAG